MCASTVAGCRRRTGGFSIDELFGGSMAALVDQSVLESLPHEQRQKLVKRARQHQINLYLEREKELAKSGDTGSHRRERRPKERVVHFNAPDKLKDAISNFDEKEGDFAILVLMVCCHSHI